MILTRENQLQNTPDRYLLSGYLDSFGAEKAELVGSLATTAAVQWEECELSPQEARATLEAFKQCLEMSQAGQVTEAAQEALDIVASMYNISNNAGLAKWLLQCCRKVSGDKELQALLRHFEASVRQYAVIIALKS